MHDNVLTLPYILFPNLAVRADLQYCHITNAQSSSFSDLILAVLRLCPSLYAPPS